MRIGTALVATMLGFAALTAQSQFVGTTPHDPFHDTTILRPPAGDKVAIIVFEDLGCPGCAAAHPIELQVAEKYHVPLVRYDFPLAAHIWTFDGAVDARYIEDTLKNPRLAGQFRSDVFLAQALISSKDDLRTYASHWFQQHGLKFPAVVDPDGKLAAKVQADRDLGVRLNVVQTPTLVVVTRTNYQVIAGIPPSTGFANDPQKLGPIVEAALAQTRTASAPAHKTAPATAHKPATN
jgi:thiol-disulfide isomerase/thioredoxin